MAGKGIVVESAESTSPARIMPLDELAAHLQRTRDGQTVVHCHGVFDLLHIGHIKHFESAKQLGDILVVTVTPDRFVNKGPNRPAFDQRLRAEAVAALQCVDYVAINDTPLADRPLRAICPDIYVKGSEYRDAANDTTGGIVTEKQVVEDVGAQMRFTDDVTFSSSTLINRFVSPFLQATQDYLEGFRDRFNIQDIIELFDNASKLKVLTIGEAIIDEYQYCEAIGKSSKEPMLCIKPKSVETFCGGILAVASHVAAFTENVTLSTVLGEENSYESLIRENLDPHVATQFAYRSDGPTIVKRRFIDSYFFHKLFEVYEMNDRVMPPEEDKAYCQQLEQLLPEADVVIVIDFGHSMLSNRAIDLIASKSKFLAVNAQSNAGNIGYHTIGKYPRADFISLAENEMRLESRDRTGELEPMIEAVAQKLSAKHVAVTRGSRGSLCYDSEHGFATVPALTTNVKDRMGAGDTFMSVTALAFAQNAPTELAAFIGNAAGAHAVGQVGHRRALQRVPLVKHMQHLLK